MGMFMSPSMDVEDVDIDDEDLSALGGDDLNASDDDLENELLELIGETQAPQAPPPIPKPPLTQKPFSAPPKITPIEPVVNSGPMEDIFKAPPPPSSVMEALNQRLTRYNTEFQKATAENNTSKAKRFGRIIKQYKDAIKAYENGREVDYESLPTPPGFPEIPGFVRTPVMPVTEVKMEESSLLVAFELNSNDDFQGKPEPTRSMSLLDEDFPSPPGRTIEPLVPIAADLNQFNDEKPVPKPRVSTGGSTSNMESSKPKESASVFQPSKPIIPEPALKLVPQENEPLSAKPEKSDISAPAAPVSDVSEPAPKPDLFGAPSAPKSIMEALEQRLTKYESEVEKAKEMNNGSKLRRMGRIVKQYQEAIALYKKGKPVAFDELPTPPGFAPIPVTPVATPAVAKPTPPGAVAKPDDFAISPGGSIIRGGKASGTKLTLQEKQLAAIVQRQKEYKIAALKAKKRGDLEQAKAYLRTGHGFDKLIQASQSGLPVDMATVSFEV